MDVLTGKTAKTSDYYSRYNGLFYYYNKIDEKEKTVRDLGTGELVLDEKTGRPIIKKIGKYQLQTTAWLDTNSNYTVYVVKENDTWDKIALNTYGNPTYYWLICDFNRIIDPFKEPKKDDIILLPVLGSDLKFERYY